MVKMKHCYFATRDPSKGGLHIAEVSVGFPKDCIKLINEKCLELVSSDGSQKACLIYPVGDGRFIVAMARKVQGSRAESRPHHIIKGFVLEEAEFNEVYKLLPENHFEKLFFESEGLEYCQEEPEGENRLIDFRKGLDGMEIVALHNILSEVVCKNRKVQLVVNEGEERLIQAICYDVLLPQYRNRLLTVSNGECTMSEANLLITSSAKNKRNYVTLNWEDLLELGKRNRNFSGEEKEVKEKSFVEEAVEKCMEYIENPMISENTIYYIRKRLMTEDEKVFEEFQAKLRSEIETLHVSTEELPDYVQIMCLAFENHKGICRNTAKVMLTIPYDMEALFDFLKIHCRSKREKDKYLEEIIKLQMESYDHFVSKQTIRRIMQKMK